MIVECPHCKSLLRTDSRAIERAGTVRCGACLNAFDALENISLDAAVDAPSASPVRQRTGFDRAPGDASSDGVARVRHRHSSLTDAERHGRWYRLGPVAVLLTVAVFLGAFHLSRNAIAQTPMGHWLASGWCGAVGCEIEPLKDYGLIRVVHRQIYAHPTREKALIVSLAMVNDAHFAQDFPVLHVNMTDRSGGVIARGQFAPADYLDDFDNSALMQPGRAVDVEVAVEDPGADAVSFDLAFH